MKRDRPSISGEKEVEIISDLLGPASLRETLAPAVNAAVFHLRDQRPQYRGALSEPTVLVAAIGSISGVVSALVTGLMNIREHNKIVIEGAAGWRVEFPARLAPKKLEAILRNLPDLDIERIRAS